MTREVHRDGAEIKLKSKEFLLLKHFIDNKNIVLTKTSILEKIWGYDFIPDTNIVEVLVCRLRSKVDEPFEKNKYIRCGVSGMYLKNISRYFTSNNIKLFITLNIIIIAVLLIIGIVIYRQITVYVDNSDRSDINEEVVDIKGMYKSGGLDEILGDLSEDVGDVESYFLLLIENGNPVYAYYPMELGPFTNEQLNIKDSTANVNLVKTEISGDHLEYYITSLNSNLVFIVGQSTEERNEFYAFLQVLFAGGFIFFLIISSVLSYLFIKRSLSPINELINKTREIVEDGNYRERISYLNRDYTYSHIVKNFNDLIAHIEYLINGITDTIDYFSHEVKTSLNRSLLSIESAIKSDDNRLMKETLYETA